MTEKRKRDVPDIGEIVHPPCAQCALEAKLLPPCAQCALHADCEKKSENQVPELQIDEFTRFVQKLDTTTSLKTHLPISAKGKLMRVEEKIYDMMTDHDHRVFDVLGPQCECDWKATDKYIELMFKLTQLRQSLLKVVKR